MGNVITPGKEKLVDTEKYKLKILSEIILIREKKLRLSFS